MRDDRRMQAMLATVVLSMFLLTAFMSVWVGFRLRTTPDDVIKRLQVTPSEVLLEVKQVRAEVHELHRQVEQLKAEVNLIEEQ